MATYLRRLVSGWRQIATFSDGYYGGVQDLGRRYRRASRDDVRSYVSDYPDALAWNDTSELLALPTRTCQSVRAL